MKSRNVINSLNFNYNFKLHLTLNMAHDGKKAVPQRLSHWIRVGRTRDFP